MRTKKSCACDVCKVREREREKVSHRFCFVGAAHVCAGAP